MNEQVNRSVVSAQMEKVPLGFESQRARYKHGEGSEKAIWRRFQRTSFTKIAMGNTKNSQHLHSQEVNPLHGLSLCHSIVHTVQND